MFVFKRGSVMKVVEGVWGRTGKQLRPSACLQSVCLLPTIHRRTAHAAHKQDVPAAAAGPDVV